MTPGSASPSQPPGSGPRTLSTTPVPANTDVFYSVANPAGVPYSFLTTARALAATRAQRTAEATTYEDGLALHGHLRQDTGVHHVER